MALYERFEVIKKLPESRNVISLYLAPADGQELKKFKPGQHLLFRLHIPGIDIPVFRYYSFSDTFNDKYYRVSVKKECVNTNGVEKNGLCSGYMFDVVKEGDVLEAKGPSGEFCISPGENAPLVLIAGGIGITPLLCMLKSVAEENKYREAYLFYGVNEREEHSFFDELQAIKDVHRGSCIYIFYNRVKDDDEQGRHFDYEGFISVEKIVELLPALHAQYYVCGPAGMMKYVTEGLERLGVERDTIHTESFNLDADPSTVPSGPLVPEGENETSGITIEFNRSGKKLVWDDRYRSILEFAEAHDIEISSGCLFGDCGTCLTKLNSGEIKYLHETMAQPGVGKCLPCSCVPCSNIVLDA